MKLKNMAFGKTHYTKFMSEIQEYCVTVIIALICRFKC